MSAGRATTTSYVTRSVGVASRANNCPKSASAFLVNESHANTMSPPRKKRRAADKAARAGSRHRTTIKSGLATAKFGRRSISLGWEWG